MSLIRVHPYAGIGEGSLPCVSAASECNRISLFREACVEAAAGLAVLVCGHCSCCIIITCRFRVFFCMLRAAARTTACNSAAARSAAVGAFNVLPLSVAGVAVTAAATASFWVCVRI